MPGVLRNPRVLFGVVVVAALVAIAMWPRPIAVETAVVSRGGLAVTIDEDGRTRVRDRFVLTAPVAGELLRVALRPGDPVVKGRTLLAVIRAASPVPLDARSRAEAAAAAAAAEANIGRAAAERARAASAVGPARERLRRTEALASAGAVARELIEDQQAALRAAEEALRAAEFAVAQAEHDRDVARARLGGAPAAAGREWHIVAPVSGVVLARHHESQSVVPAGERLVEVGDVGRLEIVADLLSSDAVRVSAGAPVRIEQWGGEPLSGRVQRIEPGGFTKVSALGVEEQRVNVIIDFEPPADEAARLGDNFRVEVRIVIWQSDSVLTVPTSALFRRGDEWAVFVVQDARARERPVTIGHRSPEAAEVLSGLAEGDTVVIYPPDTLTHDVRVVLAGD